MTTDIFDTVEQFLAEYGLKSVKSERPWGGFFAIDKDQTQEFADIFFDGIKVAGTPKILVVAPNQRLSWQYHNRRAEIWRVYRGQVGAIVSDTDEETELQILDTDDVIELKPKQRHRLVGLEDWAVLAEIWKHTNPDWPSDEDDIVRVSDDYGR